MKQLIILFALTGLISLSATANANEIKQQPVGIEKSYLQQDQEMSELKILALSGSKWAQYEVGRRYYKGVYVPQDYTEALKWLLMSAHQGDSRSQYYVGLMYENGQGTKKDDIVAERWMRLAAEAGILGAQWTMGMIYCNGWGFPEDQAEGEKWFIRLAERGRG